MRYTEESAHSTDKSADKIVAALDRVADAIVGLGAIVERQMYASVERAAQEVRERAAHADMDARGAKLLEPLSFGIDQFKFHGATESDPDRFVLTPEQAKELFGIDIDPNTAYDDDTDPGVGDPPEPSADPYDGRLPEDIYKGI